jgi:hypothetical protein
LNQLEEKNAGTAEDLVDYVLKDFCFWILPSDREDELVQKLYSQNFVKEATKVYFTTNLKYLIFS